MKKNLHPKMARAIELLTLRKYANNRAYYIEQIKVDFDMIEEEPASFNYHRRKRIYQLKKQGYTVVPKSFSHDWRFIALKLKEESKTENH